MVSYQQGQRTLNNAATLPRRLGYINPNGIETDTSMRDAVYAGVLGNRLEDIRWHCPSTNCTWTGYKSLAVCSKCVNIKSVENPNREEFSNPNMTFYPMPPSNSESGDSTRVYRNTSPISKELQNLSLIIVDWSQTLKTNRDEVPDKECALYWCANTYNASVDDNQFLKQSLLHSNPEILYHNSSSGDGSVLNISATQFWVDLDSSQNISAWMVHILSWFYFPADGVVSLPIDVIFDWISKAMTAHLQSTSGTNQPNTTSQAFGNATTTEYILHIRWWWLSLPVVLIASTLMLQLATMVSVVYGQTAVWKSSTLALLFHGPGIRDGLFPQGTDDLAAMEDVAEQMTVRLGHTDRGWELRQEPPRSV